MAAVLAAVLGLPPDLDASDDHLSAFGDGKAFILERRMGNPFATSFAELLFPDRNAAAEALLIVKRHRPGIRIADRRAGEDDDHGVLAARLCRARPGPDPESFAREPNATRFRVLGEPAFRGRPDDAGVVWLFGEPGAWRFEQYLRPGSRRTPGSWSGPPSETAARFGVGSCRSTLRLSLDRPPVHSAGTPAAQL